MTGPGRSETLLVTGSEGRIGRHLVRLLADAGQPVRGLDLVPPTGPVTDAHVGDLRDLDTVRRAVAGAGAVLHAGAIPFDTGDGSAVIATNALGTWNVLQAAVEAGVPRVIAFSSINAQGSVGGWWPTEYLPVDDRYPPHPATPYQLSKHLGEEMCRSFSERHGLVTVCLRPVWVTNPTSYTADSWATEPFLADWRDDYWAYIDVRDVGEAVLRALALQGIRHDRFLLAAADTSVRVPTRELVEREFSDVPWPTRTRDAWLDGDPYRALIDCHHATAVLGWEPRHSWRHQPPAPLPGSEV